MSSHTSQAGSRTRVALVRGECSCHCDTSTFCLLLLSTSHKHKLSSTLQRTSLTVTPANDQDEIQQFQSAENEQPTYIISRQPPMGISFVEKEIAPDVQTDEYETHDSDEEYHNVLNGAVVRLINSNQQMRFCHLFIL